MTIRFLLVMFVLSVAAFAQMPPIEPGVSQELAKWRAAHYSDVRYKLNLTLEKMSPVLKGTIEIRVKLSEPPALAGGQKGAASIAPIVLDWRRIRGHEDKSTISNAFVNGKAIPISTNWPPANAGGTDFSEHLIFTEGVVAGENVIKLDFTSPILTSGSAITRYVDKEDGSEYLYSLFVPSDASTAFPVFDQPDLKARFKLDVEYPREWLIISNTSGFGNLRPADGSPPKHLDFTRYRRSFEETKPISTYVFVIAAGPFSNFREDFKDFLVTRDMVPDDPEESKKYFQRFELKEGQNPAFIYVRKSQAAKFKPHAAEVFRLNREAIKYFEEYFDYKFPWPKYDLVLIPEFPFGGMEHAGATFLRESAVIFPQEPTKNDHISRATLIFHEAAHQWFGDTVTMRWFDDLWLKEGFATFTAYKAMERIMPDMNAWKVFYERVKQAAYQTDSTRGTTPIYHEIKNLSAAKSAYGNIVYNKAPAFLRQAEFYLGEDKFRTAVRAFLRKHEFGNAGWENLVGEFEAASNQELKGWANNWVLRRGVPIVRLSRFNVTDFCIDQTSAIGGDQGWPVKFQVLKVFAEGDRTTTDFELNTPNVTRQNRQKSNVHRVLCQQTNHEPDYILYLIPNFEDYSYGIFLLDEKSRDYVLKNIQNEKDAFLRSMMWGALWDSVREGELDPREFVELVVRVLSKSDAFTRSPAGTPKGVTLTGTAEALTLTEDESTTALLLNRVGTAMNYYIDAPGGLAERVEGLLIAGMQNAPTQGQRITYYRAFLNIASSEKARGVLKRMLRGADAGRQLTTPSSAAKNAANATPPSKGAESRANTSGRSPTLNGSVDIPLKTKDKFDIVMRLLILGDPDAPRLLAELEKTETSDDAKRYAYAAKAGIGTAENKAKYWNDFVNNKEISESWIEAAFGPWNSIRHSELTLPYLERALRELPNHKRNRKIFFVNGWLGAFIGGQRSEEALAVVNKFLADNPNLDRDLRLKILENVDVIERAVRIRDKFKN